MKHSTEILFRPGLNLNQNNGDFDADVSREVFTCEMRYRTRFLVFVFFILAGDAIRKVISPNNAGVK